MGDLYLLKFGGNALDGDGMDRLCREVAALVEEGVGIAMVHGGGPAISAEMERVGMKPVKVAGKRVTDEKTMEVVEKVLRGINGEVVGSLERAGCQAVGMPGYFLTECERDKPQEVTDNGKRVEVDYGLTGEVVRVDPQVIYDIVDQHIVPVIYPVGSDGTQHLNVNADDMAAGIAAGAKAKEMIAITDVPGILRDVGDPSSLMPSATLSQIDGMIADGTISGGMVAKVEACRRAVLAGVGAVRMVSGKDPGNLITDIIKGTPRGTLITK